MLTLRAAALLLALLLAPPALAATASAPFTVTIQPGGGGGPVALVRSIADPVASTAVNPETFTVPAIGTGHALLGELLWENNSTAPHDFDTVTVGSRTITATTPCNTTGCILGRGDNARFNGDGLGPSIWWMPNVQGSPTTITYSSSGGAFWYDGSAVSEFSGIPANATVEASAVAPEVPLTPSCCQPADPTLKSPSTPALAASGDFLWGAGVIYGGQPSGPGPGWTQSNNFLIGGTFGHADEWQIYNSTAPVAAIFPATASPGTVAYAGIVAIKMGAGTTQTIASITPSSATVNTAPCADGTTVTSLTATMSPATPAFAGTWSVSGDTHFRISGSSLVCNGSVPASVTPYTPTVTATPTSGAIAPKSQVVAVTIQTGVAGTCVLGNHGNLRARAGVARGTAVAEDGCILRGIHSHVSVPPDNYASQFYSDLNWWHNQQNIGHFNSIRVGAYLGPWYTNPPCPGPTCMDVPTLLSQLDIIVANAAQAGMYVIISDFSGDQIAEIDWSLNSQLWAAVAPHFANNTNVIYELKNEGNYQESIQTYAGHMQDIYLQVRAAAPNTMILAWSCAGGPCAYQGDVALAPQISYANAVIAFHGYGGTDLTLYTGYADTMNLSGFPVMMDEVTSDPPGLNLINAMDNRGISWTFLDGDGFCDATTGIAYGNCTTSFVITWPQD